MNKSFPMLVVVLLLGACAGQPVPIEASNSLINYADIANEISVNYQPLDGPVDRSLVGSRDVPVESRRKNEENDDSVALSL